MRNKKILIIIPAYNEEATIGKVITEIKQNNKEVDILVVNDGSTDSTFNEACKYGVMVIDLPCNLGIGGAMQTGYIYALKNNYDIAVQVDGDGQHNPADISQIIKPVANNEVDMIIGSRFVNNTGYKSTIFRRSGMIYFTQLINLLTGKKISDTTSGFRAVNRKIIEQFAKEYPVEYPEVEVIVKLNKMGYKIKEIPVLMQERSFGKSSITPVKSIYYMIRVTLGVTSHALSKKM